MPLIRGHHSFDNHFTQIPNAWARDTRLSFKARGILLLLLSHTEGWSLSIESIARQNGVGKDSIRGAIRELEEFGYLKRSQENPGRFGESIWVTTDPSENPMTENPMTENPTPKNNNIKKTNNKNYSLEFESFWEAYPRKVAKKEALRAFVKAREEVELEELVKATYEFANDANLPETQFIPYPATWLNRASWLDGPLPERIKSPEQLKAEAEAKAKEASILRAKRIEEEQIRLREEEELLREKSAPPPTCEHGESIVRCRRCL